MLGTHLRTLIDAFGSFVLATYSLFVLFMAAVGLMLGGNEPATRSVFALGAEQRKKYLGRAADCQCKLQRSRRPGDGVDRGVDRRDRALRCGAGPATTASSTRVIRHNASRGSILLSAKRRAAARAGYFTV
jgi:hypothetical protein